MKKKLFFMFVATLFAVATFTSCDDIDGDWDDMKWRTEVKTNRDDYVEVPTEGGTYVFSCKNYSGFWISDVLESIDGKEQMFYPHDGDNTWNRINTTWATVNVDGNKLTVTIEPNTTSSVRKLNVTVTAGDIFDYFRFFQPAASK